MLLLQVIMRRAMPRGQLKQLTAACTNSSFLVAGGAGSTNPYSDIKSQKAFEKGLIEKTSKQTGDIILYDNRIVLYKLESDVMIYLVGAADENEILLYNTLLAFRDSLHLLFKYEKLLCSWDAGAHSACGIHSPIY